MKRVIQYALLSALLATMPIANGCDEDDAGTGAPSGAQTPSKSASERPPAATQPIIPVAQMNDWCPEHGLPESICALCNETVAASLKEKGDWCDKHPVPASQCFTCHPELKEQFAAAYREKYGKEPPAAPEGGQ